MDIKLTITKGKDREINLTASTMNELVEKIIEWQDFEEYVKIIKQFKKQPTEEYLKEQKESGWYYIKEIQDETAELLKEIMTKVKEANRERGNGIYDPMIELAENLLNNYRIERR